MNQLVRASDAAQRQWYLKAQRAQLDCTTPAPALP
jgi:hypothetical protein